MDSNTFLTTWLKNHAVTSQANQPIPPEVLALSKRVSASVENFVIGQNLISRPSKTVTRLVEGVSLESLNGSLVESELQAMVQNSGIPTNLQDAATQSIVNVICKYYENSDPASIVAQHTRVDGDSPKREGFVALESLYAPAALSVLNGPSLEAFGANINLTVPDLKAAIVVTLMAFHLGVAPRLMPVRPTAVPAVRYDVDRIEIYDMDDPTGTTKTMIQLYADADLVSNELKQIVPLAANDTGATDVLVSDGVIRLAVEANILDLSINASLPGYERINRTDLVADGAKLSTILVTITETVANPDTTETFALTVPESKARFTRTVNTEDASDRTLSFTHEWALTKGSLMTNGSASAAFGAAGNDLDASTEAFKIRIHVAGRLNLKTGVVLVQATPTISGLNPSGGSLTATVTTLMDTISVAASAYTLDARFSEENMRKSTIIARSMRRSLEYNVPTGRNYALDLSFGQADDERTVGSLANIMRVGEDLVAITAIGTTIDQITDQMAAVAQGLNTTFTLGHNYAAGNLINPATYAGTLALADVTTIRDSDRSGDIKQRVMTYLTGVVAHLQQTSFLSQQLAAGARPTWRMLTSPLILDAILGQEHIHNHLNKGTQVADSSGIEYRLVLPNGTVIEVVTTTFTSYLSKMVLIPFIPGAPESPLNFGHLWDFGTLVGSYQPTDGRAANRRIYANTRQMPIPTCPIGATIDVTGLDIAVFLTAPTP
jgi:hypothetical protein